MAYLVAITGGIASGKSAVCDRLASHGVRVVDADLVTRELVAPGAPALAEIVDAFGAGIVDEAGSLDRARLRALVFEDAARRAALEAILHPRVHVRMRELAALADGPYVVLAIPLLAETGRAAWLDCVVVVHAPRELRRARLIARDGIAPELAEAMLAAQAQDAERLALADEVLVNDGSFAQLLQRTDALHARLLERALAAARP